MGVTEEVFHQHVTEFYQLFSRVAKAVASSAPVKKAVLPEKKENKVEVKTEVVKNTDDKNVKKTEGKSEDKIANKYKAKEAELMKMEPKFPKEMDSFKQPLDVGS